MRVILHMDMDAFYAAIEQRDDPSLRGKPVIVGGTRKRGVVSTASYEARPFGVHSALPIVQAMRRCPQAIVLPVRMSHYVAVSAQIMEVLDGFSPRVEPLSLDEAFLDMSGAQHLFGEPDEMARAIKDAIFKATRLTSSVGIARNKFLAKLASDQDKPDGITWVPFEGARAFIAPLPVRRLWGVGPRAAERLAALGLTTIGEVADADPDQLRAELGSFGDHIGALARAEDEREVVSHRERKSVGSEHTLERDVTGRRAIEAHLRRQCERVARELRAKGIKACSVRVKLRYSQTFQLATRDGPLPMAANDSASLFATACCLLDRLDLQAPIRLVGAAAFDLTEPGQAVQADLFAQARVEKHTRLEQTLDAINERFGEKVQRGCFDEEDG
jgi:DNA polymerase-4